MFIEEKMKIRVTDENNAIFTGTVYKIDIVYEKNEKPHALLFVSQDKKYISQEGDFGCAALWADKIQSIEVLEE